MPDVAQYPRSVIYGNFPDTFSFHIHIFAFPFVRFREDKSLPLHFSYLLSEQHILCKSSQSTAFKKGNKNFKPLKAEIKLHFHTDTPKG